MMFDQDLPNSLWAEATKIVVYIQNRCPHALLKGKTPEEAFTRSKPDIGHLRVFGCPIYIHIPKEKRMKMDPFGKKGIFVSYSESSKAYRIYIPGKRQIEVSRDVTFHEEAAFRKSKELSLDSDSKPTSPKVGSPSSSSEREENEDVLSLEPTETLERSLEEPPTKRRSGWLKETLQEEERLFHLKAHLEKEKDHIDMVDM